MSDVSQLKTYVSVLRNGIEKVKDDAPKVFSLADLSTLHICTERLMNYLNTLEPPKEPEPEQETYQTIQ